MTQVSKDYQLLTEYIHSWAITLVVGTMCLHRITYFPLLGGSHSLPSMIARRLRTISPGVAEHTEQNSLRVSALCTKEDCINLTHHQFCTGLCPYFCLLLLFILLKKHCKNDQQYTQLKSTEKEIELREKKKHNKKIIQCKMNHQERITRPRPGGIQCARRIQGTKKP